MLTNEKLLVHVCFENVFLLFERLLEGSVPVAFS